MKLLEQLEQQSQLKREREQQLEIEASERSARYREITEPAMQQLSDYLKQLTGHFNYLNQRHAYRYQLPHYGQIVAVACSDFKTLFSTEESHCEVRLEATARIDKANSPQVELNDQLAGQFTDLLLEHGLHASRERLNGDKDQAGDHLFQVYGTIIVSMKVRADVDTERIVFDIVNTDRLGGYQLTVPPESVDDEFLDRLGRFLARESDFLLREELSEQARTKLRAQVRRAYEH